MNMLAKSRAITCVACLCLATLAAAKDIVIGQSTALSGPLASSGAPMSLGARVCFDMVNAAGGIHGRRIRLVSRDDQYKVDLTEANVAELVKREDVLALLGGSGTANNLALLQKDLLGRAGIVLVGPRTGGSALRESRDPAMFHIRASYATEVQKAMEHFSSVGMGRIGVVYQNDEFGLDGLKAARAMLEKKKREPAFVVAYERNSIDMAGPLQAALHGKPQAILLLSTTSATAEFTRQYRASGGSAQLIALSVNDASAIIRSIGVAAAQGLAITSVFPNPARSDLRILKEYRTALERFAPDGTVPSVVSLEGFVVARVIVEALRRAGPNASRASLAKALESLGDTDLGGFVVDFGPGKRAGSQYVELTVISRHGDVLR